MVNPASRKQVANAMVQEHQLSQRTACQLTGISRTVYRYKAKQCDDERLRVRLKELAVKQSAYGYLLLHGMLKAEGPVVNKKRTCRIYTEERLQERTKKRKKQ
jgi:putative transposase